MGICASVILVQGGAAQIDVRGGYINCGGVREVQRRTLAIAHQVLKVLVIPVCAGVGMTHE